MADDGLIFASMFLLDESSDKPPPKKKRKSPVVWERPWLAHRRDPTCENVYTLMCALREAGDTKEFRRMMRMDPPTYAYLLSLVENDITKMDTNMREAIPAEVRLSTTMRYLAFGHNPPSLVHQFIESKSSVHRIVDETCEAIVRNLAEEYLSTPSSAEEWSDLQKVFQCRWNFPNCVGALDGKHIRIRKPPKAGSEFYNYKGFHSVALMALVDGNYEFRYVDVGSEGRNADGGIWKECSLSKAIKDGDVDMPGFRRLPGSNAATNHVIVGDDAFPLGPHLVKPYKKRHLTVEERILNYRLSRARRVSENAFGILASRFRIFLTEIDKSPDRVTNIVLAACCLHNMLRRRCGKAYLSPGSIDSEDADNMLIPGEWREHVHLTPLEKDPSKNTSAFSKEQRHLLRDYFNSSAGSVPWQWKAIDAY